MEIIQIYNNNSLKNFSYIIKSDDNSLVICIDPFDADLIENVLNERSVKLTHVLNTHQHHDHIKGNDKLLSSFSAELLFLDDQQTLAIDDYILKSYESFGHTMDHYVFTLKKNGEQQFCFSGDTLFGAGVGNCKNGGVPAVLYDTVSKLKEIIRPSALMYTGHDYLENNLHFAKSVWEDNQQIDELLEKCENTRFVSTTFADELKINPFLNLEYFKNKFSLPSEKEAFIHLRSLRDNW